ncbi:MAG: ATP-dependent helicase [Acidimicrobiales bacterium]
MFSQVDKAPSGTWARGLNEAQLEAASHRGGALLIVAGAGTGKTRTLAARVASLLEDGAAPERILLLTFSRRAAAELLNRVAATAGERLARQVWGGTFHSVANRLLRRLHHTAGLPAGFTVLDQADSVDLFGMVRAELRCGEGVRRFPRKETIAALYSRMVNTGLPLTEALDRHFPWCREHEEPLRSLFTAYSLRKRAERVLDYDDLLLFWRGLAAAPGGGAGDLFDHVLVDEYQDTNVVQADILAALAPQGGQLTVVGDDAQAIYGFRAATVENMRGFTERWPGARTITLEQNYRSTPSILAVANALLENAPGQLRKELRSQREDRRRPRLTACYDEADQSSAVCELVLELREEGLALREQAVLFRAGRHSDALELELARRDIPFVKHGGLRYLEAAHVKDLLAMLRVLENPADRLAWRRTLGLLEGVGPAALRRISAELGLDDSAEQALERFVESPPRSPPAAAGAASELAAAWSACRAGGLSPAAQVERLRPFCELVFPARYDNAQARLADLDQLAAAARQYPSRSRFLAELTLDPPDRTSELAGPPHLDDDYLVLSTIHSAKGGEWRAVHLIHAADGDLPSDMALSDRDGLAEERRLLYVALTRAIDVLSITFPLRRHTARRGDRHHYTQLSRFLAPLTGLFDEGERVPGAEDPPAPIETVGLADEVDAYLHGLWLR